MQPMLPLALTVPEQDIARIAQTRNEPATDRAEGDGGAHAFDVLADGIGILIALLLLRTPLNRVLAGLEACSRRWH